MIALKTGQIVIYGALLKTSMAIQLWAQLVLHVKFVRMLIFYYSAVLKI